MRRSKLNDGFQEFRDSPRIKSGYEILDTVSRLQFHKAGKNPIMIDRKRKHPDCNHNWKKRSIFFTLPYWSTLLIRHKLCVMHVEKNICDNLIGSLFSIEGKNKDTLKARFDLQDLKIRKELHVYKSGNKFIKPSASFTLTSKERVQACRFLKNVRFPNGFASNISRCVNVDSGKLSGLKSNDSHVLLQRLLPLVVRCFVDKNVDRVITKFSNFFRCLCSKIIRVEELDRLEQDIVIILWKLERIFPPVFFDVMVHLSMHLPYRAKIVGHVTYSRMYPIERSIRILKQYVWNKSRPEGSIAEAYVINESIGFCSMYLQDIETRHKKIDRNDEGSSLNCVNSDVSVFRLKSRPVGRSIVRQLARGGMNKAHWYILNKCDEVVPFIL